jgi:malate dehydrogenase
VGKKIAIVGGTGDIGSAIGSRLLSMETIDEIVLIGSNPKKAEGKQLDFRDAAAITGSYTSISCSTDLEAVEDSDIVVVTAGQVRTHDMRREDLLQHNTAIIRKAGEAIRKKASDAFVIVVTNPVDSMTAFMHKVIGGSPKKICGMSQVDSARFKSAITEVLSVEAETVTNAMVLGEHGETMVPLFSQVKINGRPIEVTDEQRKEIHKWVQGAGKRIINLLEKGGAAQAPAAGVVNIVKSHLKPEDRIITCVALYDNYGISGVFMGAATLINTHGVTIQEISLSNEEKRSLYASAEHIKKTNSHLEPVYQFS